MSDPSQVVRWDVIPIEGEDDDVIHRQSAEGMFVHYADYAKLKAENERLRKAGDSVVAAYCAGDANVEKWKEYPVVREWLAAKGGQS